MRPTPTFSASWYRVKDLKARLRPGAQISRQYHRGERCYIVRDPAGNQFYRLSDPAYRFAGLLDGRRSVGEAWELCGGRLGDECPTQPEAIQVLSQLHAANLLEVDISADGAVLLRRHQARQRRQLQSRLLSLLFPRIPLWDPDSFLKTWLPVMRGLFGKWGALLWLLVTGLALMALAPEWRQLQEAAANSIAPHNWPYLWATFAVIKGIHELGHAFACRRFGGECHELGVTFLVFVPMPYVDTSSAWGFASRWQRICTGAAGMLFELFAAALCAFVWLATAPGVPWHGIPVHELAYNAMLVASITTLAFNANPLLRYDGYYILSDFLELPNLQQRASEYLLGLVRRHLFGVASGATLPPPGQRLLLFFFAVAANCYRTMVSVLIILVVATQVPVLGIAMAAAAIVTWLVAPVAKLIKYLALDPELHRRRGRAWAVTLVAATILTGALGVIPAPNYIYATGMLEPSRRAALHMAQGGIITEIRAVDGQALEAGEIITVACDPQLDMAVVEAQARLAGARAKAMRSLVRDQAEHRIDLLSEKIAEEKLDDAERKRAELTVRAPFPGRLVAPELRHLQGVYLARGAMVGTVADNDALLVRSNVEQRDAELLMEKNGGEAIPPGESPATVRPVRAGIGHELRLAGRLDLVQHGSELRVINGAQKELVHQSLGQAGGEEIATDPRERSGRKSLLPEFELQLTLANPGQKYLPGQRAYLRFAVEEQPLLWQWGRRFQQLVQTHASQSRWL